ncbi:MAG: transglycosylase SLT domain-containing protein, partial [Muribaculaceae bacterium]|nr:transglycosylase SLT domain-containing protein [Muribaculaceae bacterium]
IGNGGNVSDYDNLFKKYAAESGYDWRLLAAISYQESHFNPNAVSWAGARGLMQIMPRIGAAYGISQSQLANPETSIKTAVRILKDLDDTLKNTITDDDERLKFMLACYNGGIGHISDARRLAKKHGLNPNKWYGNAERGVMMKSDPKYYRSPEVKYGYMRGRETTDYVSKILNHYNRIKAQYPA